MVEVMIKGAPRAYKFGYGALMVYEQLTGKAFAYDGSITATLAIHYACILYGNPDINLSLADFAHIADSDAALRAALSDALKQEVERFNNAGASEPKDNEPKGNEPKDSKKKN